MFIYSPFSLPKHQLWQPGQGPFASTVSMTLVSSLASFLEAVGGWMDKMQDFPEGYHSPSPTSDRVLEVDILIRTQTMIFSSTYSQVIVVPEPKLNIEKVSNKWCLSAGLILKVQPDITYLELLTLRQSPAPSKLTLEISTAVVSFCVWWSENVLVHWFLNFI